MNFSHVVTSFTFKKVIFRNMNHEYCYDHYHRVSNEKVKSKCTIDSENVNELFAPDPGSSSFVNDEFFKVTEFFCSLHIILLSLHY